MQKGINMAARKRKKKAKWGVARKVAVVSFSYKKPSIYAAESFKVFRLFKTRDAARSYKAARAKPANYTIVNVATGNVVR